MDIDSPIAWRDSDHEGENFVGLSLIATDARNAKLIDCTFERCTFSSVKLDGATLQCKFVGCKIEGINFFVAKRSMLQLEFDGCLIRHSSFAELKLPGILLTNCTLQNVDFADAHLSKANFHGSSLEDCTFRNSNLTKADFRQSRGYIIDPTLNRVRGAHFDIPEVLSLLGGFGIEID
jgi:fluoroquinolone resistance protein